MKIIQKVFKPLLFLRYIRNINKKYISMSGTIKETYVRRTEREITSERPDIPPQGSNPVDDANLWTENSIFKNELAINQETGELFTQDGIQPVHLSKENAILSGMTVSTSGVSLREINVSAGKIRINGRVYSYNSTIDIDDASIYIDENVDTFPRLDAIAVKGDTETLDEDTGYYGVDFKVFKGLNASDIPIPSIDSEYLFLGFVLVMPNQTVQDVLRPLSINELFEAYPIFSMTPEQFQNELTTRKVVWKPNTLYLTDQLVESDNNLYKVPLTFVSSESLLDDVTNDNLIGLGSVSSGNVIRFSHIGTSATQGSFSEQFFNQWNANTRILDSLWDISNFINSFAPTQPVNIGDANLVIVGDSFTGGVSKLGYSNSNVVTNIVSDSDVVEMEVDEKFVPYNTGTLKSYLYTPNTSYSTSTLNLANVPNSQPNTVIITSGSSKYDFTVVRDDHYGTQQGYKGFYDSIYANVKTLANLTASSNSYRFNLTHFSSGANTECIFYVESERLPNISNVDTFVSTSYGNLKYLSGVPVLKEDDTIKFNFEVSDAVRYFYNFDKLVEVDSDIMELKTISFANTEILDVSNRPPFTDLPNSSANGVVLTFANVECNISANVVESLPQFNIKAYNVLNEFAEVTTPVQNILIDSLYEEANVRIFSGSGEFPSGYAGGGDWGNLYTEEQSQANIMTNEELQFFGGSYFYPKTDYSSNISGIYFESNLVSYPDYTNSDNTYRWATFHLGSVDTEKFYNFEIRETSGINYELEDGITMSANLKVYLKVDNPSNSYASTGWLDLNKAYDIEEAENPENDGDKALDLGWGGENPNFRRATFGTIDRTGEVYVRIGTNSKSISFKDVVYSNANVIIDDTTWSEFNLGNIQGESYVIISINGTNGLPSDFLNGTTMTSDFDAQLRVLNTDDLALGTDWINFNESYPANSFVPVEYGDPALDLTYYEDGVPDPTIRKVTFGPTTRTGMVSVRLRTTGYGFHQFSNVSLLYPEEC